ncbi:tRNA (N6-isopentenyl adenosine(37)-C2)-methylthiotransferase MiaB [Mogibacterium neglectum]|uniref:tRNA (N6-isopentenyl adenosine(37)-C2)-methylthiotransferase MiaB n=1 Tax=Mogibacterium neglectum TaxID=114528 RepID=UPI00272C408A|nr:tRNA (N6-isopentenyl adenosine(37)-C2)-methylthiotransferase MiaB [Mogibacterium neglectum]WLD75588.1 tRNA (N6-isopentenyl adenosine(37)-C2)-methylthiotransferase MiaB [Mogibacterium neglectum]
MNEHDSENIAGMLEGMGYVLANDPYEAEVVVLNTCSVREHADKRFYGMLGQFKKRRDEKKDTRIVCVCGCMPQQPRVQEEIKKSFSWVDVVFGTQTICNFPRLLNDRISTGKKQFSITANNSIVPDEKDSKRLHKHKALVNITYGCNNFCTYCIVPYTRGREKSRSLDDVVNEVKELVADGVIEVMLLGQNVNSFIDDKGNTFPTLVRAINDIEGLARIRFMTSNPKDLSDELIDCYRTCERLCKHIHLPVQSGSSSVLKRMNRRYDREKYIDIINKLKATCPNIAITTDIIVGFPGETEQEFEDTLSLVEYVKYDSAFTFIYSPREGTPAAGFSEQIPYDVKHERFERLNEVTNKYSLEMNKRLSDKTVKVLIDGSSRKDDKSYSGRTDGFKLVNVSSGRNITGQLVDVKITDCKTFSIDGVLV